MRFLFCISILFFSGCTKITPDFFVSDVSEISTEELEQYAYDTGLFESGRWPNIRWWTLFQDNQLSELINIGIADSPTLSAAQSRFKKALAVAQINKSILYPDLFFDGSADFKQLSEHSEAREYGYTKDRLDTYSLKLDFSYVFDFWNREENTFLAAWGKALSEKASYAQSMLILTTSIATNYYQLQYLYSYRLYIDELVESYKVLKQFADLRYDGWIDNIYQVFEANIQIATFEKEKIRINKQISIAQDMLKYLLGKGPDYHREIEEKALPLIKKFPLPEHIGTGLLAHRPDIATQLLLCKSYSYKVKVAKAGWYPEINLRALAGIESIQWNRLFKGSSFTGSLLPQFAQPLFVGGRINAKMRETVRQYEESVYRYEETILNAAKEVADNIATVVASRKRLQESTVILGQSEKIWGLQILKYQHRINSIIEVIRSDIFFIQKTIDELNSKWNQVSSIIALTQSLGGGYFNEQGDTFGGKENEDGKCRTVK